MKLKVKKSDEVIVISGNYKGTRGKILEVFPKENKAIVEGVNKVKRAKKPQGNNPGGIIEKNLPIHISNIALYDEKVKKATRVGYKFENDKKIRFSKKTGNKLD